MKRDFGNKPLRGNDKQNPQDKSFGFAQDRLAGLNVISMGQCRENGE